MSKFSQAEQRSFLLLAIIAMLAIAVMVIKSCSGNDSFSNTTGIEVCAMDSTASIHLLPDTIQHKKTAEKRKSATKKTPVTYPDRPILDETIPPQQ